MRRGSLFVVLAASVTLSAGCGYQPGGKAVHGGLAVVDLDTVAQALGRSKEMENALTVRKSAWEQALKKGKDDLEKQIAAKKTEFGEDLSEEQKKQLAVWINNANQQLVQASRKAEQDLQIERQKLIADFRNEMGPLAQQIAAEKGLGVVIPKNEGFLLAVDPGVDITADLIKAYQMKKPAPAASATAASAAAPVPQSAKTPSKPASPAPAKPTSAAAAMPEDEFTR